MKDVSRVLIRDNDGKFLLVYAIKNGRNRWAFPGGKVDPGETKAQATCRETLEEVGITVYNIDPVTTKQIEVDDDSWLVNFYYAHNWSGTPAIPESESTKIGEIRWVSIEEMDALPQVPRLLIDVARQFCKLSISRKRI